MATSVSEAGVICKRCNSIVPNTLRHCATCQHDMGFPNVRVCCSEQNKDEVDVRFDSARKRAEDNGYSEKFSMLCSAIQEQSGVVVSMVPGVARSLFDDPSYIYQSYPLLVDTGIRKPAGLDNDRHRSIVDAMLFGSFGKNIRYGVLSLTESGIPTYGGINCRLRSETIDYRTSFLEMNSYRFVEVHKLTSESAIPLGYQSCWDNRHKIVFAKISALLSDVKTVTELQAILISSDGKDRSKDDFIEAHIYDGFDRNAIKSMVITDDKSYSRTEQTDIRLAMSAYNNFMGSKS